MRKKLAACVVFHSVIMGVIVLTVPSSSVAAPIVAVLTMCVGIVGGLALVRVVTESNDEDEAILENQARVEHSHAESVEHELDSLRNHQNYSVDELKTRIFELQKAKEKAASDRERLMKSLMKAGAANANGGVTMIIENVQKLADKANLGGTEECHDDSEYEVLSEELEAAEDLLREVEQQRTELEKQVKDCSAEMFNLKATVDAANRKSLEHRARTMLLTRSSVKRTDVIAKRMEDMLKAWVMKEDLNVNFSEHSHAIDVQKQFERLDIEFITRYFTHVTNPEYERGQHRLIRVNEETDPKGEKYGELVVSLDDDKGRTLGLRFDIKKQAPDIKAVGFVLAMYLKAMTREFRDFGIKV